MFILILQNNYSEFNEIPSKIRRTEIGNKFAPPYVIIYMAALEEEFPEKLIKESWLWSRYVDDIFMIW